MGGLRPGVSVTRMGGLRPGVSVTRMGDLRVNEALVPSMIIP